jgi:hypothetical protein
MPGGIHWELRQTGPQRFNPGAPEYETGLGTASVSRFSEQLAPLPRSRRQDQPRAALPVSMPTPGQPPVKIICLSCRPDSGDLPELSAAFAAT